MDDEQQRSGSTTVRKRRRHVYESIQSFLSNCSVTPTKTNRIRRLEDGSAPILLSPEEAIKRLAEKQEADRNQLENRVAENVPAMTANLQGECLIDIPIESVTIELKCHYRGSISATCIACKTCPEMLVPVCHESRVTLDIDMYIEHVMDAMKSVSSLKVFGQQQQTDTPSTTTTPAAVSVCDNVESMRSLLSIFPPTAQKSLVMSTLFDMATSRIASAMKEVMAQSQTDCDQHKCDNLVPSLWWSFVCCNELSNQPGDMKYIGCDKTPQSTAWILSAITRVIDQYFGDGTDHTLDTGHTVMTQMQLRKHASDFIRWAGDFISPRDWERVFMVPVISGLTDASRYVWNAVDSVFGCCALVSTYGLLVVGSVLNRIHSRTELLSAPSQLILIYRFEDPERFAQVVMNMAMTLHVNSIALRSSSAEFELRNGSTIQLLPVTDDMYCAGTVPVAVLLSLPTSERYAMSDPSVGLFSSLDATSGQPMANVIDYGPIDVRVWMRSWKPTLFYAHVLRWIRYDCQTVQTACPSRVIRPVRMLVQDRVELPWMSAHHAVQPMLGRMPKSIVGVARRLGWIPPMPFFELPVYSPDSGSVEHWLVPATVSGPYSLSETVVKICLARVTSDDNWRVVHIEKAVRNQIDSKDGVLEPIDEWEATDLECFQVRWGQGDADGQRNSV